MDDSGLLYVADRENHRVQIFDQDGKFVNQIVNMHRPCTVTIFENKLYVGELGYFLGIFFDKYMNGMRHRFHKSLIFTQYHVHFDVKTLYIIEW